MTTATAAPRATPRRWAAPSEVRVVGDSIEWRYGPKPEPVTSRPLDEVLGRFVDLERAAMRDTLSTAHLERFAKTFGVFHSEGEPWKEGRDPLEVWFRWVGLFASFGRIVEALARRQPVLLGDVERIAQASAQQLPAGFQRFLRRRRVVLDLVRRQVPRVLAAAEVRPVLVADRAAPLGLRLDLVPHDLASALSIALLRRIQSGSGGEVAPCGLCGELFRAASRVRYCPRCVDSPARARERQRRSRRRKRKSEA